jgi:hypothetical protein
MTALSRELPASRVTSTWRQRPVLVTAVATVASAGLLVDLLLVGHTTGEEIWGPITAAMATLVGLLSLAFLLRRGTNLAARVLLIGLWVLVAFFGFGGYNSHRLPQPADTITDQRPRPPVAPLAFTALGIAGAAATYVGSRRPTPSTTLR